MKTVLRICLAQINTCVGDIRGNIKKIEESIKTAKIYGASIIAFPELAITGYPPEDLLLKKYFIDENLEAINILKERTDGIVAIVGFADRDLSGKIYNAAAILQNGKIKGIYHKRYLPNYGVFDEKRYFHTGRKKGLFSLNNIIFGINVCEDIWVDKGVHLEQAKSGARFIINISASPFYSGKINERCELVKNIAKKNNAFIGYVNLVGGQDELVFDGGSLFISPSGEVLCRAKRFEEDLLFAEVEIEGPSKTSKRRGIIHLDNLKSNAGKKIKIKRAKVQTEISEIYNALVLGTRDYVRKNNFQKVIIGLSGGIDSSLVAVISCDAIGRGNVIGVTMPSMYTSSETKSDAQKLAENLGIEFYTIPIESTYNSFISTLSEIFRGLPQDETEENLQARIRGNILMALSNKFKYLVLSTGNKSELAVGYCTLYGDMVGGFSVLKDVPKTMVYKLARYANRIHKKELIPASVFTRPPTAELKPGQKDRDKLPPYDVLDKIIKGYIEENLSWKEIKERGYCSDVQIVKEVINMIDRSEYKRRQTPPGIKITPVAFGKDRRIPITSKYRLNLKITL